MRRFVFVLLFASSFCLKAALPLALVPGVALVFDSGALAASYATAITLVGSIVGLLSFSGLRGDGTTPRRIEARIKNVERPTPSGWTAASSPGGSPTPPANVAPRALYVDGSNSSPTDDPEPHIVVSALRVKTDIEASNQVCYDEGGAGVCAGQILPVPIPSTAWVVGRSGTVDYMRVRNDDGTWTTRPIPRTGNSGCPDGYSVQGGSCVLTDVSKVKDSRDGKCGVSGRYGPDPFDLDCDSAIATGEVSSAAAPSGGVATRIRDSAGDVSVIEPLSDGGVRFVSRSLTVTMGTGGTLRDVTEGSGTGSNNVGGDGTGGGGTGTGGGGGSGTGESLTDCDKYPDSAGCAKLGSLDGEPAIRDVTLSTSGVSIGLSETGSCPADRVLQVQGRSIGFSWAPICDAASRYFRPMLLVLATFSAVLIFAGVRRGGD